MGKFYIFTEALRCGYVWLVIAAGVNSVVSVMYFEPQPSENPIILTAISPEAVVALAATATAVLFMGIFLSYFWSLASNSIFSLM
jgi:NADH-quinone oxidoreductase subunit N